MAQQLRTVRATIARTNDNGLQTKEQPGAWLNISKYADPRPPIPPVGAEVDLSIDTSGFIREIALCSTPSAAPSPAPAAPERAENACAAFSLDRATLWARCLQAAATASMGQLPLPEIEEMADRFFKRAVAVGARKAAN